MLRVIHCLGGPEERLGVRLHYRYSRLPSNDGIYFDMRRCPVAEYFRSSGAADLCVGSWCNLDYGLAEMWGGWLERTGTLAGGDDCCRF
ncbi:MAG: L-2-amino-thiazoline-4-carboxylic acid hydrolase, partial [Acidobacteriota bacterium]